MNELAAVQRMRKQRSAKAGEDEEPDHVFPGESHSQDSSFTYCVSDRALRWGPQPLGSLSAILLFGNPCPVSTDAQGICQLGLKSFMSYCLVSQLEM